MDILHETWFWIVLIAAPIITVAGILARLARREPADKYAPFAHKHSGGQKPENKPQKQDKNF